MVGYGGKAPKYYGWLFEEHGLQHCEVYVDIPSHPCFLIGARGPRGPSGPSWTMLWRRLLTTLCSQNLPATAGTPFSLYPIQDRFVREWTTTMVGRTWRTMPSTRSSCNTTPGASFMGQWCRLGSYAKEVMTLT
jgi:hypothetical protein